MGSNNEPACNPFPLTDANRGEWFAGMDQAGRDGTDKSGPRPRETNDLEGVGRVRRGGGIHGVYLEPPERSLPRRTSIEKMFTKVLHNKRASS